MQSRHINYLEMLVQFASSLVTLQKVSKLVVTSMESHSCCGPSDVALLAIYKMPHICSVDPDF